VLVNCTDNGVYKNKLNTIIMQKFEELKELLEGLQGDVEKFDDKLNKSAGTRVRQGMQAVKKMAQEIRLEIQEKKNA